jgi:predicted dehydrogenase
MAFAANDTIQIALIGAGGMGSGDTNLALRVPGVKLVAVADIYDGRLRRAKEVWGNDVATTRDYREIIGRKDIDAVIIATPDHWHARITREALGSGKDVYCEKPMVHSVDEGPTVIEAQKSSGRILQIGSQYASNLLVEKARDLVSQGAIGQLNMVEAWLDRNTALGAWQYSIPPDATPKRPFEPVRLFRWRNYNDYGTGLAGDLYVHLLTGLHVITGSLGPTRVYGTGGTRFWTDGRDAPDVMLATFDYPKTDKHPEFTLALRVNFVSSEPQERFGFRFVGSEGTMVTDVMRTLTVSKQPRETEPGFTVDTFPKAIQEQYLKDYYTKYPRQRPTADSLRPVAEQKFTMPAGADAHRMHHQNFYQAVRTRKPFFEDAVFGFRTAGPALLANESMREGRPLGWDPVGLRRV